MTGMNQNPMNHSTEHRPLPPIIQTAQRQFAALEHHATAPVLYRNDRDARPRSWLAVPIAAGLLLAVGLMLSDRPSPLTDPFGDRPQPDPYSALERSAGDLSRWGQGFGSTASSASVGSEARKRITGLSLPARPRPPGGFAPSSEDLS